MNLKQLGLKEPQDIRISSKNRLHSGVRKNWRAILEGSLLVIDPSVGSQSSLPGYAIYEKGQLLDYGKIDLDIGDTQQHRLYSLGKCLREEFGDKEWDFLIVEAIPSLRFEKFGRSLASQVPLHRAVGAVLASVPAKKYLEVSPKTWHTFVTEDYKKSDDLDAVVMGYVVVHYANSFLNRKNK